MDATTARAMAQIEAQVRARVLQLWQTRLLRFTKLTVADEIENAMGYYESTFLSEIPKLYADLEADLGGQADCAFFAHGPVDGRRP
jgi:phosphoenolpyruvate carboxylase